MTTWTCEICNVTLRASTRSGHVKTKKHIRNVEKMSEAYHIEETHTLEECTICSIEMDTWTCEICNITLKASSKYGHVKTKKHNKNLEKMLKASQIEETPPLKECVICCSESRNFKKCSTCNQKWCSDCDGNLAECPYCRASLGREEQLRNQRNRNAEWQLDQDAFRFHRVERRRRVQTFSAPELLNILLFDLLR